ncbi:MAG: cell division topological specificity factor MinE [bacterium]|nr:cell division topological specificity factor MinE [bacterium]
MGLFTDFYNTVAKFFRPQDDENGGDSSKSVATNRLKLVLMQDRTNLTPKILEQMRGELIDLLSKYVELDKELLELNFEHEGDQVALMLSIPVIRAKDEEEIEAAINNSKQQEDSSDDADENSDEEFVDVTDESSEQIEKNSDENDSEQDSVDEEFSENTENATQPIKKKSKKTSENIEESEENLQEEVFE